METEMDVEVKIEQKTTKRKAFEEEEEEEEQPQQDTTEDIMLVNFFGEFKVPTIFWGVYKKVEEMGLLYMHRKTYKPLMIIRRCDESGLIVTGYNIFFQTKEEKAIGKVGFIKLDKALMGDDEEDRMLSVCHQMDQIADRYIMEEEAETEELTEQAKQDAAIRYCDEFLGLLDLSNYEETASKKRRVAIK